MDDRWEPAEHQVMLEQDFADGGSKNAALKADGNPQEGRWNRPGKADATRLQTIAYS